MEERIEMSTRLTIAMAQLENTAYPEANLQKAQIFSRQAVKQGADILVFPEMFMGRPLPDRPPAKIVEDDGGEFLRGFAALAEASGLSIIAGCWEKSRDPKRVYNTACIFSPEGKTIAAYRKLHLFDALNVRESDTMVQGDALPPLVEIKGMKIGIGICYDLRFPELLRYLALQGAQAVILPSAWYQGPMKEDHWLTLLRARAIENTLYVAGCNLVGPSFCGRSVLFDPFGVCLADAGESEKMLVGTISSDRLDVVRQKLPSLANRRNLPFL
jgi:predicted amidohydrolase